LVRELFNLKLIRCDAFFEPMRNTSSGGVLELLGMLSEVVKTIADFFCIASAFLWEGEFVCQFVVSFFDCI